MPETPEAFCERAHRALRTPPAEEWETWPFTGPVTPRELQRPVEAEGPRYGVGGVDCGSCALGTEDALWSNDNWKVHSFPHPSGLPMTALLESRAHYDFGELPRRARDRARTAATEGAARGVRYRRHRQRARVPLG